MDRPRIADARQPSTHRVVIAGRDEGGYSGVVEANELLSQPDLSPQVSVCRVKKVAGDDESRDPMLHRSGDEASKRLRWCIAQVSATLGRDVGQTAERGTQVNVCAMQE